MDIMKKYATNPADEYVRMKETITKEKEDTK